MLMDIFDNGIPKHQSAQAIYDGLCTLSEGEEMGILSEMFSDVSYDGQDYYYIDNAVKLKEQFERLSDYGEKMWLMDLAVWQIDDSHEEYGAEIHDTIMESLGNSDLGKRLGVKRLFIDNMLAGNKAGADDIMEAYYEELHDFSYRLTSYEMSRIFSKVMNERGRPQYVNTYNNFAHAVVEKVRGLRPQNETRLILESRALLTSYDDFILGLRVNQELHKQLEQQYKNKAALLQAQYEEKVKQLYAVAAIHGIKLELENKQPILELAEVQNY